jgi:hypothetical protein
MIFPKRKISAVENGAKIFLLSPNGDARDAPNGEYERQRC